jgi:hypothetical protein
MMKTVLKFGLLSGAIASGLLLLTMPFHDAIGFGNLGLVIGYASMLIAFSLIYFGMRWYRDRAEGGTVRFGRAFAVGALIGLVASMCYVATWEVVYFNFMPDFMDKYGTHEIEKARASGESEAAIARRADEMAKFNEKYRNPAFNAAVTLAEPLPVALLVALVSAALVSRRRWPAVQPVHAEEQGR